MVFRRPLTSAGSGTYIHVLTYRRTDKDTQMQHVHAYRYMDANIHIYAHIYTYIQLLHVHRHDAHMQKKNRRQYIIYSLRLIDKITITTQVIGHYKQILL